MCELPLTQLVINTVLGCMNSALAAIFRLQRGGSAATRIASLFGDIPLHACQYNRSFRTLRV